MTGSVRVTCPRCQATAALPATRAGQTVRCGRCGTTFRVDAPPPPPSAGASRLPTAAAASSASAAIRPETTGAEWRIGDVVMGLSSLALLATRRSTQCYLDATFHGDPAIRAAAAGNLRVLVLGGRVGVGAALDVAARLARDSDPAVRAAAATSLVLFDERNARKVLTSLAQDPDPAVRTAGEESLRSLESLRKIEELQQLGR